MACLKILAITPDGQTLVSGGLGRTIKFWNLHSGKELHTLEGNSSSIDFLAINQDGQTLVNASEDGTIEVWHLPTGERLYVLKEHSSGVGSIAISPVMNSAKSQINWCDLLSISANAHATLD